MLTLKKKSIQKITLIRIVENGVNIWTPSDGVYLHEVCKNDGDVARPLIGADCGTEEPSFSRSGRKGWKPPFKDFVPYFHDVLKCKKISKLCKDGKLRNSHSNNSQVQDKYPALVQY